MSVCTRPGMMVKDLRVGYSERAGKFQGLEFWVGFGMGMDMVRGKGKGRVPASRISMYRTPANLEFEYAEKPGTMYPAESLAMKMNVPTGSSGFGCERMKLMAVLCVPS